MRDNSALRTLNHWLRRENQVLEKEFSIVYAADFANLYDQSYVRVFRYAYGSCGGKQQMAEDITAETFLRAWKNRHHFNGDEKAALGWLLHIARNLIIDTSRRQKVRTMNAIVDLENLVDIKAMPDPDLLRQEQMDFLLKMMESLPEKTRDMLVLRYILGWKVGQIAAHLNMKENTVSVCIGRAISRMKDDWNQSQGE